MEPTNADMLGILSCVIILVGVFLPWTSYLSFRSFKITGFETFVGKLLFGLILVSIILIYIKINSVKRGKLAVISIFYCSLFAVLLSFWAQLLTRNDLGESLLKIVGNGAFISSFGSFIFFISALWNLTHMHARR